MKRILTVISSAALSLILLCGCGDAPGSSGESASGTVRALFSVPDNSVRITEVMSENTAFLMTEDGRFPQWVELCNEGSSAVELGGFTLCTEGGEMSLPNASLSPGERTVVFLPEGGSLTLSRKGDTLILRDSMGNQADSVSYGKAKTGRSFVRSDGDMKRSAYPTPGYENTEAGYEAYCASLAPVSGLIINEAVLYNLSYEPQNGEYYDWVELKNASDSPIELGRYSLCDKPDKAYRCQLPDTVLEPGEMTVIFCSGDESLSWGRYFHAGFALSADGEGLYLLDDKGRVQDYAAITRSPYCGSVGRMDGFGGLWCFDAATPGEENGTGFRFISHSPECPLDQGVYNGAGVMYARLEGEGDIYYTLDGSLPTEESEKYTKPITVSGNTVIRALCREEGKCLSDPVSFSYIVNENDTLPVVSLVCDPEGMFGGGGVYSTGRAVDPVIDGNISLFEPEGGGFSQDCTIQLHGARSREVYLKKSFKITFPTRLGGDLEYDVFGDGKITGFHSILLRGGAMIDLGLTRDSFSAALMNEVCPETYVLNTRYCTVYINGEYRGIYAIREAYSGEYFEAHTGAAAEDVVISRSPTLTDELSTLLAVTANCDMREPGRYDEAASRIDLRSLARWTAVEGYFSNQDIGGNIRYVKLSDESPWQMVLYDLDYSVLQNSPDWGVSVGAYQIGPVINKLLETEEFRRIMLEETAYLYNNGFNAENILRVYDETVSRIDDASARKDCARWYSEFSQYCDVRDNMRENLSRERMAIFLDDLQKMTGASDKEMKRLFGDYPKFTLE